MHKVIHKTLFFLTLFLVFCKGGNGLEMATSYAQEVDMFSDWNNTAVMAPTDTPPVSGSSIPGATATSTTASGVSEADYSGYYKIGADLYYYDQRNGQFVIAVRGRSNEDGSSSATPDTTASSTLSYGGNTASSTASSSSSMVNLFNLPSASTPMACKEWRNPLRQKETFESSSECQLDLEKSVDLALENMSGEKEQHEKTINPMTVDVPQSIRLATEINRPKLQTVLASLSKQGCNCIH